MKRILSLICLLISVFCYADSVQQGCVKTRGRMINGKHVPGQGLPGSIVSIKDRTAIGVKNSNGTFSFPVTDNQFRVDSVKKKDYVLLDADAASKTYTHTADTLFLVMETPEQILQDKLSTERRLRRSLQTKLQARENELDSLIAIQKISQEEYQQSLQKLYAEQSENDKLISDMAERYSTLDYDQMDEFYRQVSYYIEQCEFVKADSLLKTRGNLQAQIKSALQIGHLIDQKKAELSKAESVHQHDIDELAKRCYSYYENFKMQYQNDSAAYYLEQRVQLDTTNVEWIVEYADFLKIYLAQYDKALEYLQQSLTIRKQLLGESHPDVAISYNNIGRIYDAQGDYARALEYHQRALAIRKQFFGESHPDIATSFFNIGKVYYDLGDYSRALEYNQQSLVIWKQEYSESHSLIATSYNNIGNIYNAQGDYARALEYYQQSLAIYQQVYGENHPYVATSYNNIGYVYDAQGDYERALEYHQQSLVIRKQLFGDSHPDVATSYVNLGSAYYSQGDYTHALEYFQQSLAIFQQVFGESHPNVATSYNNIGFIYSALSDYAHALEYYQQSLAILKQVFGDYYPNLATSYNNIGYVYHAQGDYARALEYLQQSLTIRKQVFGESHPDVAHSYDNIGSVYYSHGDYARALEYLQQALDIRKQILGLEHPDTKNVQEKIDVTLQKLNEEK